MRFVGAIALSVCLSGLINQPALAEKRVALAIGNANYRNVSHLPNPASDANLLASTFTQAHFDVVTLRTDLTANEMRRALREFGDKARDADVAVIYYAGHGLEVDGTNYLIPIDATLDRDSDVYDEALPLDRLLVAVEPARRLRLVILDACRDNPFARTMKRTVAQRAIGRGLARVEPATPNTMIAFAAKAGFTAFDGDSKNSPYAVALAAHLTTPGLDVRKAFGFVRDDVLKATENRQEPFIYGSLGGNDVALVQAPAPVKAVPDPDEPIRRDYEFAERVGTREGWDSFLSTYPNGFYSKLALAQRNKLAAEEKARAAAEERARLAAEGAKAAEQAKAVAEARAAEDARIAAERKKAQEEARVAEAERAAEQARKAEEEKARERAAAEKASLERIARAEEQARAAAASAKAADEARAEQEARVAALQKALEGIGPVASLSPADRPVDSGPADQTPRLLQTELHRLGCYTGSIDGNWNEASQRALALFNKSAGSKLDVKNASLDTLDVLKHRSERVCPLICEHGYRADGDTCNKIVCKSGYEVGDDNTCEHIRAKPSAKREGASPARNARSIPSSQSDSPRAPPGYNPYDMNRRVTAGGYETCGKNGCQIVPKGCTAVRGMGGHGMGGKIFCP